MKKLEQYFQEWWKEEGQYLNPDVRIDISEEEFWAKKGWDAFATILELSFEVLSREKKRGKKGILS